MEKNLAVPYSSQWDEDAKISNNDCGAASVKMILSYYGQTVTTDQIQINTKAGSGLVGVDQIQQAIVSLGFTSEYYTNQKLDNIKKFIDKDMPVIVLVHYGSLNSTQDKNFKGGHFMAVVGYRGDDGVYANDPNFKDDLRAQGDHHNYTKDEFMKAWGDCGLDKNPNFSFIAINRKVVIDKKDMPKQVIVTSDAGLRARTQPAINSENIVNVVVKGTVLDVADKVTGDSINGNSIWYQIKDKNPLYVWSGLVEAVKEEKKVEKEVIPAVVDSEYLKGMVAIYKMSRDILKASNALPDQVEDSSVSFWQKIKTALRIA